MRPVKLYNIHSKKTLSTKSIKEFCQKAGFRTSTDQFHLTPVLNGTRLQHKGWVLPASLKRKEVICDIYGNEYGFVDVLKIYKRNGLTLASLKRLLDGKIDFYKGLFLKSKSPLFKKKIKLKFTFEKEGKKLVSSNIYALARRFGVTSPRQFYYAINGEQDAAYGYKLTKIESFVPKKRLIKYI